jgi:predicted nucleotidyltransferase
LKSLKGITNRIVKHYNPESVILFGSYGKEGFGADSDIDLLVIKETDKPEPLKHQLSGFWSRRIDSQHRLVYTVCDDTLCVAQCRDHY